MSEHSQRLDALRDGDGPPALYVSCLANIRYLTGFTGSTGHLLVEPHRATLFTDGRYRTQASEQTDSVELEVSFTMSRTAFCEGLRERGISRMGIEANRISYDMMAYVRKKAPDCDLVPVNGAVERLRQIKTPSEIEAIRRSVDLNSEAFDEACRNFRPEWTETRFAAELEFRMRTMGGEGAAFPTIVASGAHGALPHAEPRAQQVEPNSPVVVDQGAILDGYCSDMTRMVSVGEPNETDKLLVRAVREAQEAAIDAVRAGVECQAVDSRAREVLKKTSLNGVSLDTLFTHSTGHGLGLEIHEGPRVGPGASEKLAAGMAITIEPGIYVEGRGGVRIEDVVVVTERGCDVLTRTPRELRVL